MNDDGASGEHLNIIKLHLGSCSFTALKAAESGCRCISVASGRQGEDTALAEQISIG